MTKKQIKQALEKLCNRYLKRLQALQEQEQEHKLALEYNKELAALRAKCPHKDRTRHSGYELPVEWTCDTCGADVPAPKVKHPIIVKK